MPPSAPRTPHDRPLSIDDPDRVRRAREVLDRAGFDLAGLAEVLGPNPPSLQEDLQRGQRPCFLRRCRGSSPREILIRLFLLGASVTEAEACRAVAPMDLAEWEELGLLQRDGDSIRALVEVLPGEDSVIAAVPDPTRRTTPSGVDPNIVMNTRSQSTWRLAHCLIRRPGGDALDVGTGSGVLALLAGRWSGSVTALDCTPQAVNVAAFNGLLNGFAHFQALQGDFFAPVEGRTFDHVFSNPPYVVSPQRPGAAGYKVFRDGGMAADGISEHVVRSIPRFLRPGGFGQTLINWVHRRGETGADRVRTWTAGCGCDVWVTTYFTYPAADYATKWTPVPSDGSDEEYKRRYDVWMDYYEAEGIEAISAGLVTLRRRPSASNWFVADQSPYPTWPVGDALLDRITRRDEVEAMTDDAALLATRLRIMPEVRWMQEWKLEGAEWEGTSSKLHLNDGSPKALHLDVNSLRIVQACRGDRPLKAALEELAASWGEPPADVIPPCLRLVRCLLDQGFVVPT
jgi:SAM-dependent methyltransferase